MGYQTTAMSSGSLAAGTQTLFTGVARLNSIQMVGDGTNAASVVVYDSLTGSGKQIAAVGIPVGQVHAAVSFVNPLKCDIGLTVVVTGTGGAAYIGFNA
jgi:hypothetical protein